MARDRNLAEDIERFEAEYADRPGSLVFARLADAYRKTGDAERALRLLDEGLQRHPNYFSAHIVRGRTYLDLGRPEEAERAFRQVLTLDAENLVALQALADIARARGDVEEAVEWFERLSQVDPLNEAARHALDDLYSRDLRAATDPIAQELARQPERAASPEFETEAAPPVEHPSEVAAAKPSATIPSADPDLLTQTMAELYSSQGLFEEAEAVYLELLKFRPGDPVLIERLAATRARLPHEPSEPFGRRSRGQRSGPADVHDSERSDPEPATGPDAGAGERDARREAAAEATSIRAYLIELLNEESASPDAAPAGRRDPNRPGEGHPEGTERGD